MNLMISETRLQHVPAPTHTDVTVDILSYAIGECALGRVLVARSVNGVCAILIGAAYFGVLATGRELYIDAAQWTFGLLMWWLPQLLLGVLFLKGLRPSAFLAARGVQR